MSVIQQIEPVRKTFLNILQQNLKCAERKTYVHRIIYIGQHSFNDPTGNSINDVFHNVIKQVNEDYNDEHLTGVFLYYTQYFCHMIEGSEDSLVKHLHYLFENENISKRLGKVKLLIAYHHINQRFLDDWTTFTAKPPTLLEKIDIASELPVAIRQVYYCIQKLYKLAYFLKPRVSITSGSDEELPPANVFATRLNSTATNVSFIPETLAECLPEYSLLEFLLETQYSQDLRKYYESYGVVPYLDIYEDTVWPIPCDFVPLNIFDAPIDPVTDLPNANIEGTDIQLPE